jgi:hypothetical protein
MGLENFPAAKTQGIFLLLLQDRLNTRGLLLLRRKNMQLESYTCELCLLREEKLRHLFFKYSFAKKTIGCRSQLG